MEDIEDIEEREMMAFSWTGLFAVTGFCSFLFGLILKMIDGEYISFFVKAGIVSFVLAAVLFLSNYSKSKKRKLKKMSPIFRED